MSCTRKCSVCSEAHGPASSVTSRRSPVPCSVQRPETTPPNGMGSGPGTDPGRFGSARPLSPRHFCFSFLVCVARCLPSPLLTWFQLPQNAGPRRPSRALRRLRVTRAASTWPRTPPHGRLSVGPPSPCRCPPASQARTDAPCRPSTSSCARLWHRSSAVLELRAVSASF